MRTGVVLLSRVRSGLCHSMLFFNRHRESILLHVKMNDIELPECASFRLLGLVLHPS